MGSNIKVNHPNGYTGILYGRRSLVVLKGEEEVLHTGFRNIDTEKELYDYLEKFPDFLNMLDEAEEKYFARKEVENVQK